MSAVKPYPAHLMDYAKRQREAALDELRPMLLEARRLRGRHCSRRDSWENTRPHPHPPISKTGGARDRARLRRDARAAHSHSAAVRSRSRAGMALALRPLWLWSRSGRATSIGSQNLDRLSIPKSPY